MGEAPKGLRRAENGDISSIGEGGRTSLMPPAIRLLDVAMSHIHNCPVGMCLGRGGWAKDDDELGGSSS